VRRYSRYDGSDDAGTEQRDTEKRKYVQIVYSSLLPVTLDGDEGRRMPLAISE
jgi:hypothetical protein